MPDTRTTYLGMELPLLEERGGLHTAREISQQPELWQKVWHEVQRQSPELRSFIRAAVELSGRIIVTGAGTSAFIGLSLAGLYQRKTGLLVQAIATTDLVSHPGDYLVAGKPVFLISFARSGNSPESVAAASLVEQFAGLCHHLVITCNRNGKLAHWGSEERKLVFALPEEANDQSLAMTSSYTSMLLAAVLIAQLDALQDMRRFVDTLTGYGRKIINYYAPELRSISEKKFERAVFLGSGPLFGAAKESQLKLQEMTDGKIICKEDTFLGLRHGPKAVIDDRTIVVYLFSNAEYVSKYEQDLVHSMKKGHPPMMEIGVMENVIPGIALDRTLSLSDNGFQLAEEFLAVCSVLPAQILAFYKSLQLGLKPDSPSATGAITRVVEGVHIYRLKV